MGSKIKSKLAHLKTMGPLELDRAPGEEPMGPLEQVGSLKQESMGPFGGNGGPEASWGPYNKWVHYSKSQRGPFGTMGHLKLAGAPRVLN